uniref:Long-chain-fatty-acid--CoA ligase n=1 Tax=Rhizochromulina marina TaxID=1034831 RepID=A0A7S2SDD9_9STRA
MEQHSVIVPDTETQTSGPIRRNANNANVVLSVREGCRTVYESFRNGAMVSPGGACLGWRPLDPNGDAGPYVFMTYNEVLSRIDAVHNALVTRNALPPNEDGLRLLAIYSRNRPEWIVAEQACFASGGATVPLYDTLGADTVEYILLQTGAPTVVCGTPAEVASVLAVAAACPRLGLVVCVEPFTEELVGTARSKGVALVSFDELESEGRRMLRRLPHSPPSPGCVATFCYTSGTTGSPKGALLTHQSLIASVASVEQAGILELDSEDIHFSYLPLPHVFERLVQVNIFASGAAVGFYQGNPLKLVEDLQALRPTIFPSVPRVLNRIYDKIMAGVAAAGGSKEALFRRALASKVEGLRRGQLKHWLWDRLIFNTVKAGLGLDRLKVMATGSAPIAPPVLDFFRCMLGCDVFEGYGQTEGCAAATITAPGDFSSGHVGPPVPCVEIKLIDVPDMGYRHTDTWHGGDQDGMPCVGRGEIVYRGPVAFTGYYKMPEKTAETIDKDGWLYSGDIGLWTLSGNLKIIDRKKNIFKLAQGEYVAAEKIENVLTTSPLIGQAFVYGDSLQSYLVAVIVPDEETAAARFGQGDTFNLAAACAAPGSELWQAITEEVATRSSEAKLAGFETVRKFILEPAPFSVEEGLLTPTFKIKRQAVEAKYKGAIDALYATPVSAAGPRSSL